MVGSLGAPWDWTRRGPWHWPGTTWTAIQTIFLIAAAIFAARQVREARRQREDQARPFVVIDFHAWGTVIEITIKNLGTTLARNVQFKFTPELRSGRDKDINRSTACPRLAR